MKKRNPIKIRKRIKINDGRPTKYKEEYCRIAEEACRNYGSTDEQLAKLLGISIQTLWNWEHEYEEFVESIKRGTDDWNNKITKRTLAQRANGYWFDEVTTEDIVLKRRKDKKWVSVPAKKIKVVKKHMAPDPSCIFFLLSNKNPKEFKNTRFVDIKASSKKEITHKFKLEELKKLPTEQLEHLSFALSAVEEEIPPKEKQH